MSQIYRQVVTLTESDKPVVGLSFTWNRGAVSISKMNRADAYSLVQERAVEEVNSGNTESAKAANIASKTLAALPKNSTVWKRKNVAPHPCANVVFRRGGKGKGERKLVKANLPIILPRSCRGLDVGTLANFNDKESQRKPRRDSIELEPVFSPIGLFIECST